MSEKNVNYEIRDDIKGVLRTLGKRVSDLSRALDINYDVLSGYLNGRRTMPTHIQENINGIISKWGDL